MKTRRPKTPSAGKKQTAGKRQRKSLPGLMPLEPRVMYDAAGAHTAASHLVLDPHHTDPIHAAASAHVMDTSHAAAASAPAAAPVTTHAAKPSPPPTPIHDVASQAAPPTPSTAATASASPPSTAAAASPSPQITNRGTGADGVSISLIGKNLVGGTGDTPEVNGDVTIGTPGNLEISSATVSIGVGFVSGDRLGLTQS
ncbi:MAG: hypothetical protein JOZ88_10405, partial [Hyphomicrobiales bacterium]|nr:hypothetical protein [Hyphomicrobiales bacterium]